MSFTKDDMRMVLLTFEKRSHTVHFQSRMLRAKAHFHSPMLKRRNDSDTIQGYILEAIKQSGQQYCSLSEQ